MSLSEPVVTYWRMSSSHQEKSIPQQRAEMLPRCKVEGLEVVREFKDEGISGGGMKRRDAFLDMLRFCQERHQAGDPIAAVVCWDTSRFSRADSNETAAYIWQFRQAGVNRLRTWERWYDFRKEEDRAIFNLQQDFTNNRFLQDHALKCLRGIRNTARAGYFPGGTVPYGFDRLLLNEKDEPQQRFPRLQPVVKPRGWHVILTPADNLEEVEVVRWLFREYDARVDVSARRLARELSARGILPPEGKGRWSRRTVLAILRNPHYVGDQEWGRVSTGTYCRAQKGELVKLDAPPLGEAGTPLQVRNSQSSALVQDAHEALVDRALWERVQAKIEARGATRSFPREGGYVLSGILCCGHCGALMAGTHTSPSGQRRGRQVYRRYLCSQNTDKGGCGFQGVREDKILPLLIRRLQQEYLAPEKLEALRARIGRKVEAKRERSPEKARQLRSRIARKDEEIREGARNVLRAGDNIDLVNAELTRLRQEREALARELAEAEEVLATPDDQAERKIEKAIAKLYALGQELTKLGAGGNPDRLKAVLRQLVSRVDVFFRAEPKRVRTYHHFEKAVVHTRPQLEVSSSVTLPLR